MCGACTYAGNASTEGACEVCGTPAAAPLRAGAEAAIVVDDDEDEAAGAARAVTAVARTIAREDEDPNVTAWRLLAKK